VVRTEYCTFAIPEVQLEVPPVPDRAGELTTIEGLIRSAKEKLEELQPIRRVGNILCAVCIIHGSFAGCHGCFGQEQVPEQAAQIDAFLGRLQDLVDLKQPFTLVIDDPSGNSFIENLSVPAIGTCYFTS